MTGATRVGGFGNAGAAGGGGTVRTTQSVFAGGFTVVATVTKGTPIVTVKPNSAAPEEVPGAAVEQVLQVVISEGSKSAQIVGVAPRAASGVTGFMNAAFGLRADFLAIVIVGLGSFTLIATSF